MTLPFKSLDAATWGLGDGDVLGEVRDLEDLYRVHTLAVVLTGNPTTVSVSLDGSHDGINWIGLTGTNSTGNSLATTDAHLVRYVRTRLNQVLGGTSPTVTATIASRR